MTVPPACLCAVPLINIDMEGTSKARSFIVISNVNYSMECLVFYLNHESALKFELNWNKMQPMQTHKFSSIPTIWGYPDLWIHFIFDGNVTQMSPRWLENHRNVCVCALYPRPALVTHVSITLRTALSTRAWYEASCLWPHVSGFHGNYCFHVAFVARSQSVGAVVIWAHFAPGS